MKKNYNSPSFELTDLGSMEDILSGSVNIDSDGLFEDEDSEDEEE